MSRGAGKGDSFAILYVGQCEPLKAMVHGVLLGTVALCALYNAAAWLRRREHHLGVNAVIYTAATAWELLHTQQHLACLAAAATEREDPPLRDAA